jgi:hypothetical protein
MEELVFFIFIGIVLLLKALIKMAQSGGGEEESTTSRAGRRQPGQGEGTYKASEKQVQDFLEQIQQRREQAEQKQKQSRRRREPARASVEQTSAQWTGEEEKNEKQEAESRKPPPTPKQADKTTRKKRTSRGRTTAKTGKVHPTTGSRSRYAPRVSSMPGYGATAPRAGFSVRPEDLTNALIWSEILRPPVSLRSEIGHDPIEPTE